MVHTTTRIEVILERLDVRGYRDDAAGVEQQPGRARQPGQVVTAVRLEQDGQVGAGQRGVQVAGRGYGLLVDLPFRHVRVVVAHHGAAGAEPAGDRPGRGF